MSIFPFFSEINEQEDMEEELPYSGNMHMTLKIIV